MKLLSCYISGFGKFVNTQFDLSQNLLVLKQENGWGKTTLAVFLESMFYGFEGRSKSVGANERLKYEPWSKAPYGGWLTFSYGGRVFRIERTFGKTPAADTVKIYDHNNMPCYDFGARADKLGELLFGVDKESYRRCVYVPQGNIDTCGLPEDLRGRLIALLTSTSQGEQGAQSAIEKLENAERTLRAKRKPAKGKLDELDERLESLARRKEECFSAEHEISRAENVVKDTTAEIEKLGRESGLLYDRLTEITRKNELAANRAARNEILSSLNEAQTVQAELMQFFGNTDPMTVNVDGLQNAVQEFYTLQSDMEKTEDRFIECTEKLREAKTLKMQLDAAEKTVASYELFLKSKPEREGAGKESRNEKRKKNKNIFLVFLMIAFASILTGIVFVKTFPTFGVACIGVGVVSGVIAGMMTFADLPPRKRNGAQGKEFDDEAFAARYAEASAEAARLREKLTMIDAVSGEEYRVLKEERERKGERANALKTGIENFLINFRFGEIYDYRAALELLRERVFLYGEKQKTAEEAKRRLAQFGGDTEYETILEQPFLDGPTTVEEIATRKEQIDSLRQELTAENARVAAKLEEWEQVAARLPEYLSEESRLFAEKQRLEKRLVAIRTAKELIQRAGQNMANQYLLPVEKSCKKYAETLGFNESERRLCFDAEGTPILEEQGGLRVTEYYSEGIKALIGFCVRIALADAVFTGEKPPLILDDPFSELDDKKTENAKRLVKTLSEKYQILYLTCKSERVIE